mgnify:CR=1 FL=1
MTEQPPAPSADLAFALALAYLADGISLPRFRSADLRGIDFRNASLEGASLAHAQISGTYFPAELSADEILMSMNFGTRLRYRTR